MRKFDAVLFDLDGTLIDTIRDLADAVGYMLSRRGFPGHSIEEYTGMVGHGVRNLVKASLPESYQADDAYVDACLAEFKEYYSAHIDVHTRPYPGITELLRELQSEGVKIGVASNKFQSGTEYLIKEFFPDIDFVAILGNRDGYPLKPDPAIVNEVLASAGVTDCSRAVMVGDSPTDMKTALNGGIRPIAVSWGYRTPAAIVASVPGVDIQVAGSVPELKNILL